MKKMIIIGGAAAFLLIILSGVGAYFMFGGGSADEEFAEDEFSEESGEGEAELASTASVYHEFHPNFVVNINDSQKKRFLQVDVAAVANKQSQIDSLKIHMPAVRNELIQLFSAQEATPLYTQEGKESLRTQTLEAIQKVMAAKSGEPTIEDVYFNKFVIQ